MSAAPNFDPRPSRPTNPPGGGQDFLGALSVRVIGQPAAKEALHHAVMDWLRGIVGRQECDRRNLMFVGPHGVGAGTLVREAGNIAGLPVFEPDLTEYFPTVASVSPTVRPEQFLGELFRHYERLPENGPLGIVLVRNLEDVLALGHASETVQNSLARIFQEKRIRAAHGGSIHEVHSSQILFVATCDRDFLRSAVRMGFEGKADPGTESGTVPIRIADLIRAGFTSRLVHAFGAPVLLQPLGEDEFRSILALAESPTKRFVEEFRGWGVDLDFAPDAVAFLAASATRLGAGVSGLSGIIDQALVPVRPLLCSAEAADVCGITVTAEFLRGDAAPRKERGVRRSCPGTVRLPFVRPEAKSGTGRGGSASARLPANLPTRPARAGSAASLSRLGRRSDLERFLEPCQAPGKPKDADAERPAHGNYRVPPPPTRLRGFTALVESETDESVVVPVTGARLVIPWEERCRHTLIVGKTGSGKTTRVLLPMLFEDLRDPERTVVVIDAQATETERIVRAASRFRGRDVRVIYFNPVDPARSVRWNPIGGVTEKSEAHDLANTLCSSVEQGKGDSPYFRQQATKYLSALIRATNKDTGGKGTLSGINDLLDNGAAAVRQLANRTSTVELKLLADALEGGNRNFETSMSEISNVLLPCVDSRVCDTTSASDLHFSELEDKPCVVLLTIPEEHVARLRPILNAFVHRLFHFVMECGQRRGGTLRRPVSLFCDEFASAIGELPDFHLRANTLRKRGLAITAAVQTGRQIEEVYSDKAGSMRAAFNHHILVPPLDWHDAEEASRSTGMMTVENYITSDGASVMSVHPEHRQVLSADEIANGPIDPEFGPRITFRFAGVPPFWGYLRAAYEDGSHRRFLKTTGKIRLPRAPAPDRSPEALMARVVALQELAGHRRLSARCRAGWEKHLAKRRGHLPQVIEELEALLAHGLTLEDWGERQLGSDPAAAMASPSEPPLAEPFIPALSEWFVQEVDEAPETPAPGKRRRKRKGKPDPPDQAETDP